MTLTANFKLADIQAYINQQAARAEKAIINAYNFAGLEFVRAARLKTRDDGGFGDITGNLRSSIGYIILKDGKQLSDNFTPSDFGTDRETGLSTGLEYAIEIGQNFHKGFVLICVAGMNYAAAVESKGRDVITGSTLELQTRLKQLLSQL